MNCNICYNKLLFYLIIVIECFVSISAAPDLAIVTNSIGFDSPHLQNSNFDYSRKVSVNVGDVLNRQSAAFAGGRGGSAGSRMMADGFSADQSAQKRAPNYSDALKLPRDNSWPPEDSDQFSRVNVNIFGELINIAALAYLQPDLSVGTVKKLRVILGDDFDNSWMSTEPHNKFNLTIYNSMKPDRSAILSHEIYKLNLSDLMKKYSGTNESNELGPKELQTIQNWLIERASCPINFVWRDLGNRFWPQWIRHGICKEKHSCSWPSGMQCRPSGNKSLRLLRWHCKKQTALDERRRIRRQSASKMSMQSSDSLYGSAGASFRNYYRTRVLTPEHARLPLNAKKRIAREERRSKRVKRLVRMLSRSSRGYYCEWSPDQYSVQPECRCTCGS